jgi:hypothetical protein
MTHPQTPRRRGTTPKRVRDADEMAMQAQLFAADWRPGDRVMAWISHHEGGSGELSRLVAGGWSWQDVGRAMHLAGISYRTGTPISGGVLKAKACLARKQVQARQAASHGAPHSPPVASLAPVASDLLPARPASAAIVAPAIAAVTADPEESQAAWHAPHRVFRPVRFRMSPTPPDLAPDIAADRAQVQNPAAAPPGAVDADTMIARMFGRAKDQGSPQ